MKESLSGSGVAGAAGAASLVFSVGGRSGKGGLGRCSFAGCCVDGIELMLELLDSVSELDVLEFSDFLGQVLAL